MIVVLMPLICVWLKRLYISAWKEMRRCSPKTGNSFLNVMSQLLVRTGILIRLPAPAFPKQAMD